MTDRLATLMHGEVEALDIPAPPATEILGAGRRLHRRRVWTQRGAAAAGLALAAVTAGAVALSGGQSTGAGPATGKPPHVIAYAVDDTVYISDGTGATAVTMPEVAQTLYYTSAGVLVRTNKDGSSDGGAPSHFELVKPGGTAAKLALTLGDVVPSTDPSLPYLAYAAKGGGPLFQAVVHDISTDRTEAAIDIAGKFTWGGWEAPPVSLSGADVYVGTDDKTEVIDWQTGQTTTSDVVPGSALPDVEGGRLLRAGTGSTDVVDAQSGRVLLAISGAKEDGADLSPDGRFAIVRAGDGSVIYNVDTGAKVHVPSSDWGWSSDSEDVFRVDGSTMTTCSTSTGQCQDTSVPSVGKGAFVRYAGVTFES